LKLADYVLTRIRDAGCDTVFGIFGSANGPLIDAFHRVEGIKYVAMQHEQAASFAAEGFGKTAKRSHAFGTCIATSGPGGHNLVTGISNLYYDSNPGFFITGQVNTGFMRADKTVRQLGFQETPITDIVAPVTKAAVLIKHPEDIRWVMDFLLETMWDRRPGPVLLDIPNDIQKAEIDPTKLPPYKGYPKVVEGKSLLGWHLSRIS
jgi:acetolactate synthase-1/2/3 large subunit